MPNLLGRYATVRQLNQAVTALNERIDLMASQADVDALTTAVDQIASDLTATQTTLQAELDKLAAANPTVDVTALGNAIAPLDAAVQALAALTPTPPAGG
jgi:hypothetical protein